MSDLHVLANVDPNVLVPPPPLGVNMRKLPIFAAHPLQHAYRSPVSGLQLPVEFHAYSADNTAIVCLANADKVSDFLRPIGYKPVVVVVGPKESERYELEVDKEYAIVNLVMNDYADTSAGPYQALPLSIFALPLDREHSKEVTQLRDPVAALLPLLDPAVAMVMGPLAMSKNQAAFDVGRDVMGIDKFVADVRINHDDGGTTTNVTFEKNQLLYVRVNDGSPVELLDAQARLFSQLDIFGSFKLLLGKNEPIEHSFIGWNGRSPTMNDPKGAPQQPPMAAYCTSYTLNSPAFKLWSKQDDKFDFSPGCPLTDRLSEFECKPILASRDRHVSVAVVRDDDKTRALQAAVETWSAAAAHGRQIS